MKISAKAPVRTVLTRQYSQHQQQQTNSSYRAKLFSAWKNTEVKWAPIPVGLGLGLLCVIQYRRVVERERERQEDDQVVRRKYVASGPWQVHLAAALPLRHMSRLWGAFNSINIPEFLRPAGFRLYSWIFGCNLDEMKVKDLKAYPNLSAFFYRELEEGARPIANAPLVSPSDGKVLHFGLVQERSIEQIKGVTYSLDALLGHENNSTTQVKDIPFDPSRISVDEEEFANVNGISYSLDDMLGFKESAMAVKTKSSVGPDGLAREEKDAGTDIKSEELVRLADIEPNENLSHKTKPGNSLFFCVIYLAPGDYHRFHSPADWVVQMRRHFAGELFSVSPYFVKLLKNLFVLNERVVLMGKWRHGFFSMIPVGATNVGSIKINFDEALRTNRKEDLATGTYTEVSYKSASKQLGGKPVCRGEEIGGFYLGSTVVLVFEAPSNFKFTLEQGQKVKMGQTIGTFTDENAIEANPSAEASS
ncbi:phosphatidylserine decarboxylase 1 [Umbelopsis nana]